MPQVHLPSDKEVVPAVVLEAMNALRQSGSISGMALCRAAKPIVKWIPYPPPQVEILISSVNDLITLLDRKNRKPTLIHFQFDNAGVIVVLRKGFRLILLHTDSLDTLLITTAAENMMDQIEEIWYQTHEASAFTFKNPNPRPPINSPLAKAQASNQQVRRTTSPIPVIAIPKLPTIGPDPESLSNQPPGNPHQGISSTLEIVSRLAPKPEPKKKTPSDKSQIDPAAPDAPASESPHPASSMVTPPRSPISKTSKYLGRITPRDRTHTWFHRPPERKQ